MPSRFPSPPQSHFWESNNPTDLNGDEKGERGSESRAGGTGLPEKGDGTPACCRLLGGGSRVAPLSSRQQDPKSILTTGSGGGRLSP